MARTDEAKWQYWTKQINAWKASGISQRAYCEREGHKFPTFDYWRRQTQSNSSAAKATAKTTAADKLTLVPVRMEVQTKSDSIVLRGPGGWQLTIPATIEVQWLAALMRSVS
jgi:hypothetical protein